MDINCTSDMSFPAADLIWYINDKEVSPSSENKQSNNYTKIGPILSSSLCPFQAPKEYLYPQPDGGLDMSDYKLSYRNLGLRFFVDKSKHQLMPTNTMRLRCLAKIGNFFPAHREVNRIVTIGKSQFDSFNQKLTTHRTASSGSSQSSQFYSSYIVTVLCLVLVHLTLVDVPVPRRR